MRTALLFPQLLPPLMLVRVTRLIEELTSYMIQPDAQYRHRWRKGVRASRSTRDVTLSLHL